MQVSDPNNIKIYNLTAGKSVPEWLSDRKRRALLKKNFELRRRIELLQDFDMPDLTNCVRVSRDGHYILATGIYKPRVRCFEVDNLSMKFERCMDSEVVAFDILSDDYSKLVFLQNDRYVEFHGPGGIYHKLRIPKPGRDLKCHYPACDLYLVGGSPELYRFNMERGQFLSPMQTGAGSVNKIAINPAHQLICVGTQEGTVEAWDPRSKSRAATLDVARSCLSDATQVESFPSVTGLAMEGALTLGTSTGSGQVLLYDLRSDKPYLVKDHMYGEPIRDLTFYQDYVLSMDRFILKIWNKNDGKLFTSIQSSEGAGFNNLCHVPNSGLLFIANESPKIFSYYVPSLGPAPRWCSFLDNLTEELEESKVEEIYDDYKFVTKKELSELNLTHLVGSQMLRAYMHGYFMNIRLYNKSKELAQPFNYEEYKKKKIREKVESSRESRVQLKLLPKVNKELALKIMDEARVPKKKKIPSLMEDERFKSIFENPDFEIDSTTEEYRLLNPVVSRLDKNRKKELEKELLKSKFQPVQEPEELEGKASSEESSGESDEYDSDVEQEMMEEVKAEHRKIRREKAEEERKELMAGRPRLYELRAGVTGLSHLEEDPLASRPLGERVENEQKQTVQELKLGNKEITFTVNRFKGGPDGESTRKHRQERKFAKRAPPTKFKMANRKPFHSRKK